MEGWREEGRKEYILYNNHFSFSKATNECHMRDGGDGCLRV